MIIKKYLYETAKYLLRCPVVIRSYIKEVERIDSMSSEQLRKRNEQRFLYIFQRAYDKSPFYHRLYTEAGIKKEDIRSIDDIKKLPVVTKDMVKKHAEEMLTVPRWTVIGANTSGTTGTPLRIYESWHDIWMKYAFLYCSRRNYGFRMGQRIVSLRGHLDKQTTYLKVHVSNTLYLSSYNINKTTVKQYYEWISSFKPKAIEGYPSSLYSLALFLRDDGLSLNIPVAFTSSETLFDYQRALIEKQLGTEIFDLYGMTESTISLEESIHHDGYYERPGFSINEYLENGEICTSLISSAFPLIRYRSNDIIELAEPGSKMLVKSVVGRTDDYVICKDGSMVSRIDFIEDGEHIKACQWVQDEMGKVSVLIVPDDKFTEKDLLFVKEATLERVGLDNLDIEVKTVSWDKLIYTSRGKFKLIVNRLPKLY